MDVDVAAVIVTYNSESHISALLDSIPAALGGLSGSVAGFQFGWAVRRLMMSAIRDPKTS